MDLNNRQTHDLTSRTGALGTQCSTENVNISLELDSFPLLILSYSFMFLSSKQNHIPRTLQHAKVPKYASTQRFVNVNTVILGRSVILPLCRATTIVVRMGPHVSTISQITYACVFLVILDNSVNDK